jgi:hypothetical protein
MHNSYWQNLKGHYITRSIEFLAVSVVIFIIWRCVTFDLLIKQIYYIIKFIFDEKFSIFYAFFFRFYIKYFTLIIGNNFFLSDSFALIDLFQLKSKLMILNKITVNWFSNKEIYVKLIFWRKCSILWNFVWLL